MASKARSALGNSGGNEWTVTVDLSSCLLRMVPTNSKGIFARCMNMLEKQILTVVQSKKKIRGNHAFLKDN